MASTDPGCPERPSMFDVGSGQADGMRLVSVEDLRAIYRPPARGPVDKSIHHLDAHCVDFVAKSPFFVLSTANAAGV